jgi:hypothetical protein
VIACHSPGEFEKSDYSLGQRRKDAMKRLNVLGSPFSPVRFDTHFSRNTGIMFAGNRFTGRLYCTPRALWKLNWFLRDFGYDSELLDRNEVDDKNLIGLSGVVKISHAVVSGTSLLNLDAFAPASHWEELSAGIENQISATRTAS